MPASPRRLQLEATLAELTARTDADTPRIESKLAETCAALERLRNAPLAERIGVPVHTSREVPLGAILSMGPPTGSLVMHPLLKVQLEHPRDPHGQVAAAVGWLLEEARTQFKRAEFRLDDLAAGR